MKNGLLLSPSSLPGIRRVGLGLMIGWFFNDILYVLITSCRGRDMPPSMAHIRLLGIGLAGCLRQGMEART